MVQIGGSCDGMQQRPDLVSIGFKEWSCVCAAIGAGRQQVILRKGGIAEGRTGFSFKNDGFFLFPTLFHEQDSSVREHFEMDDIPVAEESIPIRYFVEVLWKGELDDWEAIRKLEPLHVLKEFVVRDRFEYDDAPGQGSVQVAVVRAWELAETWWIPYQKGYGGCRSWVDLPEVPENVQALGVTAVSSSGSEKQLMSTLGNIGISVSV